MDASEIIAERRLEWEDAAGVEHEVVVRIGCPRVDSEPGGDHCCPYEIEGLGPTRQSVAYGVDSMQALVLALQKAGLEVGVLVRGLGGTLTWYGQVELGFPRLG